jgi:Zn-dependent protease with chaperone function
MNIDDVKYIADKIKYFHLMEPNREIIENTRADCNVVAHIANGRISFDPATLNFLNEDEVLWILLHEEGHLIHHQEVENRWSFKTIIWLILMVISAFSISVIFRINLIPLYPYYPASLTIAVIIVTFSMFFANNRYFYQPYWNDEFRSDEYAVKGLFIIRPDLIAWQVMSSSFRSFNNCRKSRKRSFLRRLYVNLIAKPHPPNNIRIQRVRVLFNKYTKNKHFIL